jgi:hypothetical protein
MPFDDSVNGAAVPFLRGSRPEFLSVEMVGDLPGIAAGFLHVENHAERFELLRMPDGAAALVLE